MQGIRQALRISSTFLKMDKFNVVFVLGAPGSGKGTLCEKIVKEFGYTHFSTGELLRADKGAQDILKEVTRKGTMVPVEISLGLIEKAMQMTRDKDKTKNNFIIDGFPRDLGNRLGWERLMTDKANINFILYLDCSEQTCISRCLSRGTQGADRGDDSIDILKVRMKTHKENTMPIVEHYERLGLLRRVDADRNVDQVFDDVKKVFG